MNKVLYGFGDSLVEGHCIGVGMLDALAKKYDLAYHKYAKNGAAIIPRDMTEDAAGDDGRVPDVAAQIELASGRVPDFICFDGEYDRSTFYGAFERICFLLRRKYADSRIFYVSVHKMPTRSRNVQEILHGAAREVCEKWSIPCVDVYRCGQLNTCVDEMRRKYSYDRAEYLTDGNGTHLNAEGYEKWYLPMIEDAMKRYLS